MEPDDIVRRCQQGDLEEFESLYQEFAGKIYKFVYRRVGHKETAEDLTSQIFIKALNNLKKFTAEKGSFSAWIYRISRNTVIDYYRTRKSIMDVSEFWGISAKDNISQEFANKEALAKIGESLKKLKPEQQEIIIMRVWDDLSYKEIAQITGKSEANCKVIFSRAMRKLRETIPLQLLLLFFICSKL